MQNLYLGTLYVKQKPKEEKASFIGEVEQDGTV